MAPAAAAVRLLLVLGLGRSLLAEEVARNYPDEEVLASQSYYPAAWGKHFKEGDAAFCGKAYADGAALHLALRPNLKSLQELTGWQDGMVVRGPDDITRFWSKAIEALGKSYEGDADSGDFASRRFVVDDNTVIVSGPVAWGGARGRKLSQTWTRQGPEWKIASEMLEIEDYAAPTAKPPASLRGEVAKIVEAAEGKPDKKAAKEVLNIGKAVAAGLGKEVKELASEAPAAAKAEEAAKEGGEAAAKAAGAAPAAASTAEAAESASGHSSLLPMVFGAACLGGMAAVFYRRSMRRREAQIAGFEAMLG